MADTIDTGDLIAPLGEVLDLLDGRITLTDAQTLVTAFTNARVRQVNPGDLITARVLNQVFLDLEELRRRVALLEGTSGAPRIDRITPSPVVRVGMLVTIEGAGFDPRTSTERIVARIGDVDFPTFVLGSGPGVLKLVLTNAFGALPRDLSVRVVVGSRISNALPITVQAPAELGQGGETIVKLDATETDPPGKINVGSVLTYTFSVVARTIRPDDYKFDLDFTNVDGATEVAWRAATVIAPQTARIGIGQPLTVTASTTVPVGASSVRLALDISTNKAIDLRVPAPIDLVVGQAQDVSDPRTVVVFDSNSSTFDLVRDTKIRFEGLDLQGLKVAIGGTVDIDLLVTPMDTATGSGAGRYVYEAEVEGNPAGWSVSVEPQSSNSDLVVGGNYQLIVTITNSETVGTGTTRMVRIRALHSTAVGADSDFAGFHRFPVQAI